MNSFEKTAQFDGWLQSLKDRTGKLRILTRLTSVEQGNFGDCEPVGGGVFEMRIHYGPGYRVYYTRRGQTVYLLLIGGDKSTQKRDIRRAIDMAATIGKEQS
jgi:putative addiction module killer protein